MFTAHIIGRAGPPEATSLAAPTITASSDHDDCHGGSEDTVAVKIEPTRISGRKVELNAHVHHRYDEPAQVIGAVEVIDDRGRRVGKSSPLTGRALAARAPTSYQFGTLDDLADGYYRVQLSVLARAASKAEDFSTHQFYFHVADGEAVPVTSDEWFTQSQAGLAFSQP